MLREYKNKNCCAFLDKLDQWKKPALFYFVTLILNINININILNITISYSVHSIQSISSSNENFPLESPLPMNGGHFNEI